MSSAGTVYSHSCPLMQSCLVVDLLWEVSSHLKLLWPQTAWLTLRTLVVGTSYQFIKQIDFCQAYTLTTTFAGHDRKWVSTILASSVATLGEADLSLPSSSAT